MCSSELFPGWSHLSSRSCRSEKPRLCLGPTMGLAQLTVPARTSQLRFARTGSTRRLLSRLDAIGSGRRGSLYGRKIQIQVSRAVELDCRCAVDLAHGNAQVPLVGVDVVQAVVRGEDG